MSRVVDLVDAYAKELELPWRKGLSGSERVWMLVYPQPDERKVRAAIDRFKLATTTAKKNWSLIDISDDLGKWLAEYDYAESLFEDPDQFTPTMHDEFEADLIEKLRSHLAEADEDTVVALVGVGSLFPFIQASSVIKAVDEQVNGRLLVFFPGTYNRDSNIFRLLDARDGFNYRAIVIDPHKDVL